MTRARTRHLAIERLEDRKVLAAFAVPWPEGSQLTLSFAPDGTLAGNQPSALFKTLDAQAPAAQWKLEILRAFQTWADESNINIGVVADSGLPFGTLGLKEGDPRFGDVRIGAYPMAPDVLAVADPYDPFVANTWVGDVFLNSSYAFNSKGTGAAYDLFSVLLHEAGHVLGIGHSSDPNSPMFEQFHPGMTLTTADVAALRSLYGVRPADSFESLQGNDTLATASPLVLSQPGEASAALTVAADIGSLTDKDYYRFEVPQDATSIDVRLATSGISLLTPRLSILGAAGTELGSAIAADPLHGYLRLSLDHVQPGKVYYVRVASAGHDVFGIGSYHLTIDPHPGSSGTAYWASAGGGSSSSSTDAAPDGLRILATTPGYVEHTYYDMEDSLSTAIQSRTYQVRSADLGPGMTNVMTVAISNPDAPGIRFEAAIVDDHGNPVAATLIADRPGHFEIQAPSVESNRDYFITIRSEQPIDDDAEYYMVADFAQDAGHLQTFVNDSLDRGQYQAQRTLQVVQSQAFHFILAASDWSDPAQTGVRMTILDATGRTVYAMEAADGVTRSGDVFLDQGAYTVQFRRMAAGADTPVIFQLSGLTLSDPLGPQLRDTTQEPVDSASTSSQLTFYWLPFSGANLAAAAPSLGGMRSDGELAGTESASFNRFTPRAGEIPVSEMAAPPDAASGREATGTPRGVSGLRLAATANLAGAGDRTLARLLQSPQGSPTPAATAVRMVDPSQLPALGQAAFGRQTPLGALGKVVNRPSENSRTIRSTTDQQPLSDSAVQDAELPENASEAPTGVPQSMPYSDRLFAWLASLDADDYAVWMIASICIGLGAYAAGSRHLASRASEVAAAPSPRSARSVRARSPRRPVGLHIG
jgi:hypothetical protein